MGKAVRGTGKIKTYRCLKDGLRVGYSMRNFGDFVPEAKTMEALPTLLRSDAIEEVFVTQEALDEWRADQEVRDIEYLEEHNYFPDDPNAPKRPSAKRKKVVKTTKVKATAKKKPAVKKTTKKIVVKKKGKTSGRKLAERSV